MRHKYQTEIDNLALTDCPPSTCQAARQQLFRFVHENFEDQRNFLPALKIEPSRIDDLETGKQCCSGYALSMYVTENKAKNKFMKLLKKYPNIGTTIGTHLASGDIEVTDGLLTETNREGHVALHEAESSNISRRFQTVGPICDVNYAP